MTYFEMVKKDVENAIVDNYYNVVISNNKQDEVKLYSKLLLQMWNDEHITGNNCTGGYYFDVANTIKMIKENIEEVRTAYNFFGYNLTEDLGNGNYFEIDSRTRCYFLNVVLYKVLKETKII